MRDLPSNPFFYDPLEGLLRRPTDDPPDDFLDPGFDHILTPTTFIDEANWALNSEFPEVLIEGEVASFKVNQNKWVFFDLKDSESSVNCFMTLWSLRMPIEDGMKVIIRATPKITRWGKFSLTVQNIRPVGEGSLKKSLEKLKEKLSAEGLFSPARKRPIPHGLTTLGVISSTAAAGYADFIKILNARWGGIKVYVAHTQVQGLDAPDQIIRALKYFNERGSVQAIAILRGGGSADDLACFNDEKLVRAVAASKIPVVTGIGHEVDESLCDLAADLRASTPSNAAELLTRDRAAERARVKNTLSRAGQMVISHISNTQRGSADLLQRALREVQSRINNYLGVVQQKSRLLDALNPEKILRQGYAIILGSTNVGSPITITTFTEEIRAKITAKHPRE